MAKLKGWKEVPLGGLITEAGNAEKYETGSWRTYKPVLNREACTNCLLCWIFCPDSSILVKDEEMVGFDYAHCKGCGICAAECPKNAIAMVLDEEA
jgi:pyruvate ferredoxin oxidoreductase delta subunit